MRAIFGNEQTKEMLLSGQRVVPQKLLDLGFTYRHPELEGALETLYGDDNDLPSAADMGS